jgi:predicted nucleic-acid-binding protein
MHNAVNNMVPITHGINPAANVSARQRQMQCVPQKMEITRTTNGTAKTATAIVLQVTMKPVAKHTVQDMFGTKRAANACAINMIMRTARTFIQTTPFITFGIPTLVHATAKLQKQILTNSATKHTVLISDGITTNVAVCAWHQETAKKTAMDNVPKCSVKTTDGIANPAVVSVLLLLMLNVKHKRARYTHGITTCANVLVNNNQIVIAHKQRVTPTINGADLIANANAHKRQMTIVPINSEANITSGIKTNVSVFAMSKRMPFAKT